MMTKLRVLELFSGVGGMHSACDVVSDVTETEMSVLGAVDINTVSNEVYRHNHPSTPCLQRNITGLTPDYLRSLSPDLILMSPPCQPHTRQGKQLDRQVSGGHQSNNFVRIIFLDFADHDDRILGVHLWNI